MEQIRVEDIILPYSQAPDLDLRSESVGGVAKLDDGGFKFVAVLKFAVMKKLGAQPEQGKLLCEMPVIIGRLPTVDEVSDRQHPQFGLIKLGPGVWKPCGGPLRFTKTQAGFFTLTGCPDPAPWEDAPSLVVPA